ncbi:hypothetical protein EV702DRAFT_1202568 [Suillus placidus]|uniref:Uncharacterized protein n=1 Tax=Suillus placidus TaxID=48579 RepID=A0A9P6ZLG2_9AGAM|nr:hypothetical protein EV702DRAFT_1202568 [Suillus placidus]
MPTAEFSNTAMGNAAEQLMTIVQKAAILRDDHPGHLKLAVEIGDLLSLVFKTHGMSATTILPILLSAAMEMQEHLDAAQQSFARAPVWAKIRADDPQIQQHPLKENAQSITIARPQPQPTAVAKASAGNGGAPAPAKEKPRPKPMPKTKAVHDSKGKDTGGTRGNSPPAYTSSQKGKGKEVVSAENEAVVNQGRPTQVQKRRKGSNTSLPPIAGGALQHQVHDSTTMQTKTSKWPKVTPESVSPKNDAPKLNVPKEDIKADMDGSELIPPCDGRIICHEGYGTTGAKLRACGHCSWQKYKCSHAKAEPGYRKRSRSRRHQKTDMVVSDDDAGNATAAAFLPPHISLLPPATSVPPITTLEGETPPPAEQSAPSMQNPPDAQQQMEGLTLEVMQNSANLITKNAAFQDRAASLRATSAQIKANNTAAAKQLTALQASITSQDAALLELQGLRVEVAALQDEVKALQGESTTRDQQLWGAQDQLGQQECATAILQDAYNAIHQCLARQPHSLSSLMVPVSMDQMQSMEGLYFNLPSSVGNISRGSMLGAASAGPSTNTITGSSGTGGDTIGGAASGVGARPGSR